MRSLSKIGIFILPTMITLFGCTKNKTLFPGTGDKIQGQWQYDKVQFQKNFSLSKTDLSADYKDIIITFNNDRTMTLANQGGGALETGTWDVKTEYYYNFGNADTPTEVLQGALIDTATYKTTLIYWENPLVTKKKIKANEYKDGGVYLYTLVKI